MTPVLAHARKLLLPGLLAAALAGGSAAAASASRVPVHGPPRVVMILVDINGSPSPATLNEHQAVLNYATALPSDVRTGLIFFSDTWRLAVRPTTNRATLNAQLAAVQSTGSVSTGIRGALKLAAAQVKRLRAVGRSRFVIFSDAEEITGPLPTPPVPTDAVVWGLNSDDNVQLLRAFAHAHQGEAVSPGQAITLSAKFPPLSAGSPGSAGSSHFTPSPTPHPATRPAHGARAAAPALPWSLVLGVTAVFAVLFVVALVFLRLLAARVAGRDLMGQLERYGPRRTPVRDDDHGRVASTALDWVTRAMGTNASQRRLAQRLELAAIARKPAEWVLLGICGSVVVAATLSLATQYVLIGIVGGALIGWATMRLTLTLKIARRRAMFSDQLPDLLQLVAGSLQAGFSLPQALDSIVREDTQPAAGEFARALAEARIGADLTDGLESVANRMDSDDLRWTVMAIRIQRGVGGNLGEVLLTIASTIRERAYLRRQVRALSAEGRLSGYVLVALPVLVGGWLFISSSTYMRPLYTTPVGLLMFIGATALVVVGAMWMRVLVKVEV